MNTIATLALTSFREMVRERTFLVVIGLALFMVALSLLLGQLTFDENEKLLADLGLLACELAAVALALFLGSFAIAKEMERQTCLLILSKPVSRFQFLLGKWGGISTLLVLLMISMDLLLTVLLGNYALPLVVVSFSILMKALILLSWSMFAATLVRPILALLSGLCLYFLGHWLSDLDYFASRSKSEEMILIMRIVRWFVPNFDLFNWKDHYHLVHFPELRDIVGLGFHSLAWLLILLTAAGLLFRRKDLV